MPSSLSVPRPDNMDTRFGDFVDSDMFDISQRVKEVHESLFIVRHPEHEKPYVIMEHCADHADRFVFRTAELDGRTVEKLQYLLHVPFEQRFAEAERAEAKAEAARIQFDKDTMFEAIGAPMPGLLHRTGAIDSRRESYPKAGVYGGKGSKGKS